MLESLYCYVVCTVIYASQVELFTSYDILTDNTLQHTEFKIIFFGYFLTKHIPGVLTVRVITSASWLHIFGILYAY